MPLPHLPLQNLFCPQPPLPLLPVSIHWKKKEACIHSRYTHTHCCSVDVALPPESELVFHLMAEGQSLSSASFSNSGVIISAWNALFRLISMIYTKCVWCFHVVHTHYWSSSVYSLYFIVCVKQLQLLWFLLVCLLSYFMRPSWARSGTAGYQMCCIHCTVGKTKIVFEWQKSLFNSCLLGLFGVFCLLSIIVNWNPALLH